MSKPKKRSDKPVTADMLKLYRSLTERQIGFHSIFVRITGGALPALFLSQADHLQNSQYIQKQAGGWWWHKREQWTAETGMSRWEQEAARKKLVELGFVEEKLAGMPRTTCFRVNQDAVIRAVVGLDDDDSGTTAGTGGAPNQLAGGSPTWRPDHHTYGGQAASKLVVRPPAHERYERTKRGRGALTRTPSSDVEEGLSSDQGNDGDGEGSQEAFSQEDLSPNDGNPSLDEKASQSNKPSEANPSSAEQIEDDKTPDPQTDANRDMGFELLARMCYQANTKDEWGNLTKDERSQLNKILKDARAAGFEINKKTAKRFWHWWQAEAWQADKWRKKFEGVADDDLVKKASCPRPKPADVLRDWRTAQTWAEAVEASKRGQVGGNKGGRIFKPCSQETLAAEIQKKEEGNN